AGDRGRREAQIPIRAGQTGPGWGPRWPSRARDAGSSVL
ncbi:MAG: hypothetical protein AVDCRST_MAG08-4052, partial [uncultured Acetobacteraceae bacterium]